MKNFIKNILSLIKTKSFQDSIVDLESLKSWSKKFNTGAFNCQWIRAYMVFSFFKKYECTSFVETGTYHGYTTAFVKKIFSTKVFSCEISKKNYWIAKVFLLLAGRVKLFNLNSPDFLKKISVEEVGSNPMFYLDAHWYNYLPLNEELKIIFEKFDKAVIVIDDFEVPNKKFGFDSYENIKLNYELIRETLENNSSNKNFSVYYPNYEPEVEVGGKNRGFVFINYNQSSLLMDRFPFNLLKKHEG
ncbi:MAG: hypothetical protein WC784_05570 [Candidatus Shapirobacteria bacterium]|jgi:predicted O-methyltransferase YrrM